jgi:hypothetical protein
VITLAVSAPATGAGQRLYVMLLADRGGQPDADPTNHEVEVPVRVG